MATCHATGHVYAWPPAFGTLLSLCFSACSFAHLHRCVRVSALAAPYDRDAAASRGWKDNARCFLDHSPCDGESRWKRTNMAAVLATNSGSRVLGPVLPSALSGSQHLPGTQQSCLSAVVGPQSRVQPVSIACQALC